jgi:predicted metalloprotease
VKDAQARGEVSKDDIESALALIEAVGDPTGTNWYDAGAHGSGPDRARSFNYGFDEGLAGCVVAL